MLVAMAMSGCGPWRQSSAGPFNANVELSFPPCSTIDQTAPRIRSAAALTVDSSLWRAEQAEVVLVLANITRTDRSFSAYHANDRLIARAGADRTITLRGRSGVDSLNVIAFGFARTNIVVRYRPAFADTLFITLREHCDADR